MKGYSVAIVLLMATGLVLLTPKPLIEIEHIPIASTELALINETRGYSGLPLLQRNVNLDASAKAKCNDMVEYNYWTHNRDGKEWSEFITIDYKQAGEILATGFDGDTKEQHNGWLSSPSHAEQIMGHYTDFGSAICTYEDGTDLTVIHFWRK